MTQNNLAIAYWDRIRGERADNLERAIAHCEQALTVRTREAFPAEYRGTQRNLGGLHFEPGDWARAHAAFAAAIDAGADLLAEAYTETGRRAEVGETSPPLRRRCLRAAAPGTAWGWPVASGAGQDPPVERTLALAEVDLTMLPDADQQPCDRRGKPFASSKRRCACPRDTPARRSDRDLADALRQARANLNRLIESIRAEQPEFMPIDLDLPETSWI